MSDHQLMLPHVADESHLARVARRAVEARAALVVDRIDLDPVDAPDRETADATIASITHAIAIECAGDSAGTLLLGASPGLGERLAEAERGAAWSGPIDEGDGVEAIRALAIAIASAMQVDAGVDRPLPFAVRVDTAATPRDAVTATLDVEGELLRVSWTPARAIREAA